jgi:hypothetical protein
VARFLAQDDRVREVFRPPPGSAGPPLGGLLQASGMMSVGGPPGHPRAALRRREIWEENGEVDPASTDTQRT